MSTPSAITKFTDVNYNLNVLRAIEKFGGSAAYQNALSGTGETIPKADIGNPILVAVDIAAFGPFISLAVDTCEGHSGSGFGIGFDVKDQETVGLLTLVASWDAVMAAQHDFVIVGAATGIPGIVINFSINGRQTASLSCPRVDKDDLSGIVGRFTWGAFDAKTRKVQTNINLLKGLEYIGGSTAYETFLNTSEPPSLLPVKSSIDPKILTAASITLTFAPPYMNVIVNTTDGHSGYGYAFTGVNASISLNGELIFRVTWTQFTAATTGFKIAVASKQDGIDVLFHSADNTIYGSLEIRAPLGPLAKYVGCYGSFNWNALAKSSANGNAA